jgi:membrane-anchored mycosin MYCP
MDGKPVERLSVAYPNDELVVDLRHLGLLSGKLRNLDVTYRGEPDVHEGLGLARLAGLATAGVPLVDLDVLLDGLRSDFEGEYRGWSPAMGKNRGVESIASFGHPKPMSGLVSTEGGHPQPMADASVITEGGHPRPMRLGAPEPVERPKTPRPSPDLGRGVMVGVLDTTLYPHPDLGGRYLADRNAMLDVPAGKPVWFRAGHATFVADRILALAPGAGLQVRTVPDLELGTATVWEVAKRMMDFRDAGVDVLNLSLGCRTADGRAPFVMARAVERISPHMVVVAAAGNHGAMIGEVDGVTRKSPTWPAASNGVVAVGATEQPGSEFSPCLPWITCTAPGVDVVGAYLIHDRVQVPDPDTSATVEREFTGYAKWSGTSFAAATVSGAIAANTVPGRVSARQALADLLADPDSMVRKYVHQS